MSKTLLTQHAEAHTNLTMFGAIQSLCESGCFYGGRVHPALDKIIKICKAEQRKELKIMDKAAEKLK